MTDPRRTLAAQGHEGYEAELARRAKSPFSRLFPDCEPACIPGSLKREDHVGLCRALYRPHVRLMNAGALFPERLFLAANQVGKTLSIAFEVTCHLTGIYPPWWEGKRFDGPGDWWLCGDTAETVRDILQIAMLGPLANLETKEWAGMIPPQHIVDVTRSSGTPDAVDQIVVRHRSGGRSVAQFKSYREGRLSFQGTKKQGVWLDEEPPDKGGIYSECLTRTVATDGIMLITFTPLRGLTPFLVDFLTTAKLLDADGVPRDAGGSFIPRMRGEEDVEALRTGAVEESTALSARLVVGATWDDAPHLSEAKKAQLRQSYQPFERDARTRGIPQLGAGAVYPFPHSEIVVPDFILPRHWPRVFGLDCALAGPTAASWIAHDRETDTAYTYSVYKRSQAETAVHAEAIKGRGLWIPGLADAAALIDVDREQFIDRYRKHGLKLELADKAVEAGIQECYDRFSSGRKKIFASCQPLLHEMALYRRDERGRVVKQADHNCDADRYGTVGLSKAKVQPQPKTLGPQTSHEANPLAWMRK